MPPMPATEEAIVDCVTFFVRRRKAAKIFEKNMFRCTVKREERSLQKLKDSTRYEGFRQVHDIHKYIDKISVSVVCSVCPTCHHCNGFLMVLYAVFGFGQIVLRFCSCG